jgi:hypothetical protein
MLEPKALLDSAGLRTIIIGDKEEEWRSGT